MTGWHMLLAFGWAATAPPPQIPLRVDFQAPPNCSSAEAFYAGVRARTDRVRRAAAGESGIELRVQLTRRATGVHGELEGFDDDGKTETRTVEGDTCDEVVEALSLTTALALDPNARFTPSSPPVPIPGDDARTGDDRSRLEELSEYVESKAIDPTYEDAPHELETETETETEAAPDQRERESLSWEVGVHGLAMEVLDSDLSLGGRVFLRFERAGGVFTPSLALSLMQVRNDLFGSALSANAALTGVELTACPLRFAVADMRLETCAHAVGGFLNVAGRNLVRPESVVRTWWSVGPLARAAFTLTDQLSLEVELGVDFPLAQRRFVTAESAKLVAETPPFAPLAALGLAYGF